MSTQIASLSEISKGLGLRHQQVLDTLAELQRPQTSRAVALALGLELTSIRGRFSELVAAGKVREAGKAYDQTSNRWVTTYELSTASRVATYELNTK